MNIRKANSKDLSKVLREFKSQEEFLLWTGNKFSYPIKEEEFFQHLKFTSGIIHFSFFQQQELIGYGEITRIKKNESAYLSRIIVLSQYRGKGNGKTLIKNLLQYAVHSLQLSKISLNVLSFNKKAISLYENLGFKKNENSQYMINQNVKGFTMTKNLNFFVFKKSINKIKTNLS